MSDFYADDNEFEQIDLNDTPANSSKLAVPDVENKVLLSNEKRNEINLIVDQGKYFYPIYPRRNRAVADPKFSLSAESAETPERLQSSVDIDEEAAGPLAPDQVPV